MPRQIPVAPVMALSTKVHKVKDEYVPIKRNDMAAIENMIQQAIENKSITNGVDGRQGRDEIANTSSSSSCNNEEETDRSSFRLWSGYGFTHGERY